MLDLISTNENVDKDVCEKEKHSSNQKNQQNTKFVYKYSTARNI